MRFKKLQQESKRSKTCYVSYAIASSNFEVECNECYTNDKICSLHHELQPVSSGDMCNVLNFFRDVSSKKFSLQEKCRFWSKLKLFLRQVYLFLFLEVSVDVCGSVNRLERLFTAFHSHPLSWNTAFKFVAHEEFR